MTSAPRRRQRHEYQECSECDLLTDLDCKTPHLIHIAKIHCLGPYVFFRQEDRPQIIQNPQGPP